MGKDKVLRWRVSRKEGEFSKFQYYHKTIFDYIDNVDDIDDGDNIDNETIHSKARKRSLNQNH
jgi:hypothetical protein